MTKIVSLKRLVFHSENFKKLGRKIVLVTGCFDILHLAHRQFLQKAKEQGDVLLVGLESDERVSGLKGEKRPVNPWQKRAEKLQSLRQVDFVFPLPGDLEKREVQEEVIRQIRPDVFAVSSHTVNLKRKKEIVKKYGGRLKIVFPHKQGVSTTKILKRKLGGFLKASSQNKPKGKGREKL